MDSNQFFTLDQLSVNHSARIHDLNNCEPVLRSSLLAVGAVAGVKVSVIRKSPFKGPLIVSLKNSQFAIRLAEASAIVVKLNG